MNFFKKLHNKIRERSGFSLTELLIVVAIIALLAGIGMAFIRPSEIKRVEYDRNANSIATAAQNSLTALRNSGELDKVRLLGDSAVSESTSSPVEGGYRYVFNYTENAEGALVHNSEIEMLLPFGAIDTDLSSKYFAVGFQSDNGRIGEVFWREEPFASRTASYLSQLAGSASLRKTEKVGYYGAAAEGGEVAFAQLPTPQVTVSNYEDLVLSFYLPRVRELEAIGKQVAVRISLADEKGGVYEAQKSGDTVTYAALTLEDTAIYRTYTYGDAVVEQAQHGIVTGKTYKLILDSPDDTLGDTVSPLQYIAENTGGKGTPSATPPKGKFEAWAKLSAAFRGSSKWTGHGSAFKLGDNVKVTVTVFCLDASGAIDPTFMPRSGTVVFNGWFDSYDNSNTVTIASGRHLQNLGKLTELNPVFKKYFPTVEITDGVYSYPNASRGNGYYFTDKGSSSDISRKYTYRTDAEEKITQARQMMAINFDCPEWKKKDDMGNLTEDPIPFEPVNLYNGFTYLGNYLPIKYLYVDAPLYAGLFGYVNSVYLFDVLLVNPSVTSHVTEFVARSYEIGVGALIGTSRSSRQITNCQAYLEKDTDGQYHPEKYRVTGTTYVGGLIGFCEDETIRQNSASVNVGYEDGSSLYVGGLIGVVNGVTSTKYSYAAGNLSGQYVGGLLGTIIQDSNAADDEHEIASCYTAGHIVRAKVCASGLIGQVADQDGIFKSVMRANDNYCAVIYGVGDNAPYVWDSTLESGGKVPIYGTFEGDGFKWLASSDAAGVVTGASTSGKNTFLAADFDYDNQNYYFPQANIEYANSAYFESMKSIASDFTSQIKSAKDNAARQALIDSTRQELLWARQLESLKALKAYYVQLKAEFKNETTYSEKSKKYYYEGGYEDHLDEKLYVDTWRINSGLKHAATIDTSDVSYGGNPRNVEANLLQFVEMLYDGKLNGKTYKLRDKDCWTNEEKTNVEAILKPDQEAGVNSTFTYWYDLAEGALTGLLNGTYTGTEKEQKIAMLTRVFGTETAGYKSGYLYTHCFYPLEDAFDHAKDAYYSSVYTESDKIPAGKKVGDFKHECWDDQVAAQTFYYYRDGWVTNKIYNVLNSMTVPDSERVTTFKGRQNDAIAAAEAYLTVLGDNYTKWTGDVEAFKTVIGNLTSAAKTSLSNLKTAFANFTADPSATKPSVSRAALEALAQQAYDDLSNLYHYLDSDTKRLTTDGKEVKIKDCKTKYTVTVTGKLEVNGHETSYSGYDLHESTAYDLRGIRDLINEVRTDILRCGSQINSGLPGALDTLEYDMYYGNANAVEECVAEFNLLLGVDWEGRDSGHRIYSAYELRNIRMTGHIGSDFVYDYGDAKSYQDEKDPPNSDNHKYENGLFVDKDNGIYNNVLPYHENGDYTSYYPYLMIEGRHIMKDAGTEGPRATGVLFHYGDWLTADLIAEDPGESGGNHTYHSVFPATDLAKIVKNSISEIRKLATSPDKNSSEDVIDAFWTSGDMAKNLTYHNAPVTYQGETMTYKELVAKLVGKVDSTIDAFVTAANNYYANSNATTAAAYNEKLRAAKAAFADLYNLFDASGSATLSDGTKVQGIKNFVDDINDQAQCVPPSIDDYTGYLADRNKTDLLDIFGDKTELSSGMRILRDLLEAPYDYINSIEEVTA